MMTCRKFRKTFEIIFRSHKDNMEKSIGPITKDVVAFKIPVEATPEELAKLLLPELIAHKVPFTMGYDAVGGFYFRIWTPDEEFDGCSFWVVVVDGTCRNYLEDEFKALFPEAFAPEIGNN